MLAGLHAAISHPKRKFVAPLVIALLCVATGLLALLHHASAAGADILCVKPGGGGGCYASINTALLNANPNDTIRVAMGTYMENVSITQTVTLQGGWNLDFTQRDPATFVTTIRPADPLVAVVTIHGDINDWSAVAPSVDGFTITGARSGNHGGGLRMGDSNGVISHNVISDNQAYLLGGGVWVQRGAPLFESNLIANNQVSSDQLTLGGGMELEDTQATLTGNIISSNVVTVSMPALGHGGGIAVEGGGPVTITNNSLLDDYITNPYTMSVPGKVKSPVLFGGAGSGTSGGLGGGLALEYVTATVSSNLIQGNIGAIQGTAGGAGGIYVNQGTAYITGNTIQNNAGTVRATDGVAGGVGLDAGSSAFLSDNIIRNNAAATEPDANTFVRAGGFIAFLSTASLDGDVIEGNVTGEDANSNLLGYGGGVVLDQALVDLNRVRITGNRADMMGGLSAMDSGSGYAVYTMTNSLVAANQAAALGGAYLGDSTLTTMTNDTFANNGDVAINATAPLTITNSIIVSHTVGISYTQPSPLRYEIPLTSTAPITATYNDFWANDHNTQGFDLDPSNLTVNPQFTSDYHLGATSPVIDAGTRNGAPTDDIDGEPRPMKGTSGLYRVDIGADERTGPSQTNKHLATDPADFTLIGPGNPTDNPNSDGSNDWIGYSVLGGDVNGDNRADLFAGAPNLSDDFDGGVNDSGRVFGLYGNGTRRLGVTDLLTTTPSLEVRSWLHQQHIGQALAAADLNGDGANDLIIGSQGGDSNGTPITGTIFVFAGGAGLSGTRTLSPTMQADWRFKSGESTETFAGKNALAVAQLNGAGPADLAAGEALATGPGNRTHSGAVFVFFGSNNLPPLWDLGTMPASLTIYGPANESQLGKVAVGDVNGDGAPDLVARSPSTIYVFYGPLPSGTIDLATTAADAAITNADDGWLAAGDVNGDGKADIVVSTPAETDVVLGGNLPATQTLQQARWASFTGFNAGSLWTADWNADGKAEVLAGDRLDNRAFVIFGGPSLQGTGDIYERADWIVYGERPTDQFGYSLGSGDLDGDGVADLILGSRTHVVDDHPAHFEDAGAVYVLYGAHGQPGATPTPTPGTPSPTSTPGGATASPTHPTPTAVACSIAFSDVPPGSTFYPYIHCLACLDIINGYPNGTFRPNANVTRGQLSKIVSNSAGFNDPQTSQMFQDVPVDSTFFVYIGRLASRGYINGYPCGGAGEPCQPGNLPYFRLNNNATRGQISKIDANAAGFSDPPSGQQFHDVPVGSTYYTYTYRLVTRSVMSGYPCGGAGEPCVPPANLPYFRPNNNATRGQTSKIVSNTFFPNCSSPQAMKP